MIGIGHQHGIALELINDAAMVVNNLNQKKKILV
tara:strand:+ start:94 stop:195 length:102 start_codon:yes stop_codon:yes gene_type:complete